MTPGDAALPGAHPAPEEVADLVEGCLDGSAAARVSLHLGACAGCAQVRDDLLLVRDELRALPPVGPMPSQVAARLDSALARSREAGALAVRSSAPPATGRRLPAGLTWRRLAAAAASVVVIAGAAVSLSRLDLGSTAGNASADLSGRREGGVGDQALTLTSASFASQVAALVKGGAAGPAGTTQGGTFGAAPVVPSTQPRTLTSQKAEGTAASAAGLPSCAARLAAGHEVALVREASVGGRPVILVVVRAATGTFEAWAVPADCAAPPLLHATVRP